MVWNKIVTFVTKTFPGWIKKIVDKILIFLHIKKDPVSIDANKVEKGTSTEKKNTVAKEINKANVANSKINNVEAKKEVGEAPKLNTANEEQPKKEKSETQSQNTVTPEEKTTVQEAEKQVEESCEKLEEIAKTAEPEAKKEIETAVQAIKQRKYVVISKTPTVKPNGLQGYFFVSLKNILDYLYCIECTLSRTFYEYYNNNLSSLHYNIYDTLHKDEDDDWSERDDAFINRQVPRQINRIAKHSERDYNFKTPEIPKFWDSLSVYTDKIHTPDIEELKKMTKIYYSYSDLDNFTKQLDRYSKHAKLNAYVSQINKTVEYITKELENPKISKMSDEKTINAAMSTLRIFSKEFSLGLQVMAKTTAFFQTSYKTFVATAKPVVSGGKD